MIELKNVDKSFDLNLAAVTIFTDLNLSITEPGVYAIMGKSGSGKSTLLSLMAGLDQADNGIISIDDNDLQLLNETEKTKFRANNIGIVFQDFLLLPYLTVKENMALPLQMNKAANIDGEVEQMLKFLELEHRKDAFPETLSGGEKQRVAIGRAFICSPKFILADEPTGNLDNETSDKISHELISITKKLKQILIIVTHDLDLALKCDKIYELKDHRISEYAPH